MATLGLVVADTQEEGNGTLFSGLTSNIPPPLTPIPAWDTQCRGRRSACSNQQGLVAMATGSSSRCPPVTYTEARLPPPLNTHINVGRKEANVKRPVALGNPKWQ